ncbi:MAG: hypothetical protein IPN76_31810 [Saprospiraceae bacterium]|nr:hypothetical protein [Saprospiraceae bacterium]
MKKHLLAALLLLGICKAVSPTAPSPRQPVPRALAQYAQGFEQIVSGTQLEFPPILQKGKLALTVTPGGKAAEFQTARECPQRRMNGLALFGRHPCPWSVASIRPVSICPSMGNNVQLLQPY